jgi:hypothetical protein
VGRCDGGRRDHVQAVMEQRPLYGGRNFVGFHEEGEDDCEESLEVWAGYRAEMAAAGLGPRQEQPNSTWAAEVTEISNVRPRC